MKATAAGRLGNSATRKLSESIVRRFCGRATGRHRYLLREHPTARAGEVHSIGRGEERANLDVAREIVQLTGQPETHFTQLKDRPGHDRRYALDHAKMRTELGWAPTIPFATGLRQVVEWYRRHEAWWQEILSGAYGEYCRLQYGVSAGHDDGLPTATTDRAP